MIWFDHYGSQGIEGLKGLLRCGQPAKLDKSKKSLEDWLNNHPRQLSDLIDLVYKEFGIRINRWTLRHVLKSKGYVWKSIHKSLKSKRKQEAFDAFYKRSKYWQKRADKG